MSSNKFVWAVALLAVCIVTVAACPSYGGPVAIVNAGFENPVLPDGEWDWSYDDQGWGYFHNDGYQGPWNPDNTGAIFYGYGGVAPEGQNVGWAGPLEIDNTPDDPDDDDFSYETGGFAQVLTATLAANSQYTLTVEVGHSYYYGCGYIVQLLAGGTPTAAGDGSGYAWEVTEGTVLAETDYNTYAPAFDTFGTATLTFDSTGVDAGLLGEHLQIRLLCDAAFTEADFDDVRLDVVPEPAAMGLLGTGVLCLIVGLIRRKRK